MRYIIGIDLGTTNCCVSYVDTESDRLAILPFRIPQLTREGVVEDLPTLPSFCYLAAPHEWPVGSLNLPWKSRSDYFVGSFALSHGSKVPTRLVQSAKSWLCHPAANRRDKILPIEAADEGVRISPIESTARYLSHIKSAWNEVMSEEDADFENQEIILTVPASFDEVARTLTVEAAKLAGFQKMTLLEEPQAAFYSWISQHENVWENMLDAGACILVCDVGGGTTDFSLIEVVGGENRLSFQRIAVGDHLLLGGDNMDAAIAHFAENRLNHSIEFNSRLWLQLKHEARKAKESLLNEDDHSELYQIILQGTGSGIVGGTLTGKLGKGELQQFLLDGFFGQYPWEEAISMKKSAGFRTMGLPYEDDPSITKHLASFLKERGMRKPDYVLFNGGAMKPKVFQEAIVCSLTTWFEKQPQVLSSYHLDLAVARGAAYYGKVRRGLGVKVGGGMARGYYLVCDVKEASGEISKRALTLLARGFEEGSRYESGNTLLLNANTPVSFQLCSSHVRLKDRQGDLVSLDPKEMFMLPPIHTVLRFGKGHSVQEQVPVHLQVGVTAIGTLEMFLKSQKSEHRWALDFQLRTESGQENSLAALETGRVDQTFQEGFLGEAEAILLKFFQGDKNLKPEKLMDKLEETLGCTKQEWPPSVMRKLGEVVLKQASLRKISKLHEQRWWNLIGFLLRPGYGYPLDDFRLKEFWKIFLSDSKSGKSDEVLIQAWICYRRLAGGLNKGQQGVIASELFSLLQKSRDAYQYAEQIRALASMELVDLSAKVKMGNRLIARVMSEEAIPADFWALGRIGARHLLYGSIANVVPSDICAGWIEQLLKAHPKYEGSLIFVIGQLARKTEHRELNLSENIVNKILSRFEQHSHFSHLQTLLLEEQKLTHKEMEQVFGDTLPSGLMLDSEHAFKSV